MFLSQRKQFFNKKKLKPQNEVIPQATQDFADSTIAPKENVIKNLILENYDGKYESNSSECKDFTLNNSHIYDLINLSKCHHIKLKNNSKLNVNHNLACHNIRLDNYSELNCSQKLNCKNIILNLKCKLSCMNIVYCQDIALNEFSEFYSDMTSCRDITLNGNKDFSSKINRFRDLYLSGDTKLSGSRCINGRDIFARKKAYLESDEIQNVRNIFLDTSHLRLNSLKSCSKIILTNNSQINVDCLDKCGNVILGSNCTLSILENNYNIGNLFLSENSIIEHDKPYKQDIVHHKYVIIESGAKIPNDFINDTKIKFSDGTCLVYPNITTLYDDKKDLESFLFEVAKYYGNMPCLKTIAEHIYMPNFLKTAYEHKVHILKQNILTNNDLITKHKENITDLTQQINDAKKDIIKLNTILQLIDGKNNTNESKK